MALNLDSIQLQHLMQFRLYPKDFLLENILFRGSSVTSFNMTATIELSNNALHRLCQSYHQYNEFKQPRTLEVLSYEHSANADTVTGFLGRHQFLTLKVRRIDAERNEHLEQVRFFTKSPPLELASRMEYVEEFGVFKKEVSVYRELMPQLQKIIPNVAPNCYYADERLLVFEHLADQNFRMAAGRDGILNYDHLHCVLKTLAALHASSIIYEVRSGRKLNQLHPEAVVENAYPLGIPETHVRKQNFNNANRVFAELIKLLPKYQEDLDYILIEFPKRMAAIYKLAQTSDKYRNVFCHGDLWANNAMFQYGESSKTPIQCRLVDFQLSRYAPPMVDVITILTIPTSSSFRRQYLRELFDDYYCFMSKYLKQEQLNIEEYLPRQEFNETADKFRIVGLIESLFFSHLTLLPTELAEAVTSSANGFTDFFDAKRVEMCLEAFRTDDVYRERITDMLEDFVDNFVLNN
uniref:CHK kinase-like domain-containing protein n=1 Tax=Bactrocera latifrons TaxID=174628 RepID=A0A0K8V7L1_BACLA